MSWKWLLSGKILGDHIKNDRLNNFTLIRLVAALMVMATHSHLLAGSQAAPWFREYFPISHLGLPTFFFMSGLLVTQSLYKSPSWRSFLWRRFLRIYPAACLSILVVSLVMGPCITSLSLKNYFSSPLLYQYLWNCSLIQIHYLLPGVFSHSSLGTNSVNSSLWTIAMEIKLYLGLLLVFVLKIPSKKAILFGLIASLIVINCFSNRYVINPPETIRAVLQKAAPYLSYGVLFLLGILAYLYKDKIIIRGYWLFLLPLAFAISLLAGIFFYTSYFLIPALAIFAATHGTAWLKKITPKADLSYGIYVFAFPVEQLAANYLHPAGSLQLFLYSVAGVLPLALLSWYGVEKRAMALKNRVS